MKIQRMTYLSMLTVLALALYSLENLLPPFFPIPGMKLGLSNLVTLFLLYQKPKERMFFSKLYRTADFNQSMHSTPNSDSTRFRSSSCILDALLVLLMRIFISALLFGQMLSLLYSLIGGLAAFGSMVLISQFLQRHFPPLCGMVGGLFHNLGQLGVAILLTASLAPLAYAPYLLISGLLCGGLLGLCVSISLRRSS
jgi:heptaprenyl diphosphate synthase